MSRGSETDWLAAHLAAAGPDHPRICGFASVFHDPLYLSGQLHPRAPSVLGSWVDSGINALSVLARFIPPESLTILAATFQRASGQPVQDVQSHVTLAAPGLQGTIHTDWTADSGDKTTTLHLTNGQQWQLDHNQETATLWASSPSPETPSLTASAGLSPPMPASSLPDGRSLPRRPGRFRRGCPEKPIQRRLVPHPAPAAAGCTALTKLQQGSGIAGPVPEALPRHHPAERHPAWLSQPVHPKRSTSAVRGVAPAWRAKAALPRLAMAWAAAGSARAFRPNGQSWQITGLRHPLRRPQQSHQRREILHVRPGQHRHPGRDGLHRILPAFGEETLPNNHHFRQRLPVAQLPGGIHHQHVRILFHRQSRPQRS